MIFFRKTRRELERRRWELAEKERELAQERADIDERLQTLELLVRDRVAGYEHVAQAWADWESARNERDARYLERKKHPARAAAEVVREKGREMAELRRRMKVAEYLTALYEFHFPWLEEFRDVQAELDYVASAGADEPREDPASRFLSKDEWAALASAERYQLALERYLHSRQTPWQVGRDYERYVGYLREQAGCTVTYHGIVKGFEDLGRDVLAERNGTIEVIQCKRWAQHKLIHEKHIFQLFGTMVAAQIENPGKTVTGTFTTTTALSERAREFARVLEITVEESFPLGDYPRIKCNIARRDGERIYHLPFDQQYDTTVVEPARGELYAATCAEAEAAGFRRAWRWRGAEA
jgi:HJR/Mrr/RecB family endonuclease